MEPLFDEINAEFQYHLTGEIDEYVKKLLFDSLLDEIKCSPKYMGAIENAVMLNSWLYVTIKPSVKALPDNLRTRLVDNVLE